MDFWTMNVLWIICAHLGPPISSRNCIPPRLTQRQAKLNTCVSLRLPASLSGVVPFLGKRPYYVPWRRIALYFLYVFFCSVEFLY